MTTRRSRSVQGPQFIQYFNPVLAALKELGGSGRPDEVINKAVASLPRISEKENEMLAKGVPRIVNNIHWARFYLAKAGYIDGSNRGVWLLTDKGRSAPILTSQEVIDVFAFVQEKFGSRNEENKSNIHEQEVTGTVEQADLLDELAHRRNVLTQLKALSPNGFERFCQRLLRESGFEQVTVTGRSGDGGIDGHGILKLNPFVSFKVAFQCKRYAGSVGSDVIRDFRGSIMGRADKGILITTGSFTLDAAKESVRDGATPIELVDGEKLIDLLEQLELGLVKKRTITVYEVDEKFFTEFI